MDALDGLVVAGLAERLFTPDRLQILIGEVLARQQAEHAGAGEEGATLRAELRKQEQAISRLLDAIEAGTFAADDDMVRTRFNAARERKADLPRLIGQAERRQGVGRPSLPAAKLGRFADLMRERLQNAPPEMRKALLRLFVGQVEVGDVEIRIEGPKAALAAAAQTEPDAATLAGLGVRSSVRQWRPLRDSNPCRRRERAVS